MLNENLYYCLDYEYWVRLSQAGIRFAHLPDILAGSRLYPETKTMSDPMKAQQEAIQMLKQRLGYVPETWLVLDAIDLVKRKTKLKMPMRRYIIAIYAAGMLSAFRRNGFVKGVCSSLLLLKVMLRMHRERS